jgi:EmrB/QacA subfamily drug resistance transporter
VINPRARPCDDVAIRSTRGFADCSARQRQWVLVATILASAIANIDGSVVNVALPAIAKDLATSVASIQWVVNAYTLSLAALVLSGGAAGDHFGRRRVFMTGLAVFAIASLGCGLSFGVNQLILARAVQGFGAALFIPCSLAIIGASFPEVERGRAIGTWAGFSAITAAIGPLLGGWIVDRITWQAIFFINPFLAAAAVWITWQHLPESYDSEAPPGIDWPGALLALAGLAGFALGLIALSNSGLQDNFVVGSLAAGVLILALFVFHEGTSRTAMMPLRLFRSRSFSGINAMTLLLYGALSGAFFILPFELIQVHGYSATLTGAVFLPFTIIVGAFSRWSGGLLDRVGARLPLIVGPIITAGGFALFALSSPMTSSGIDFLLAIAIVGFGMAITVAPLTTTVINAVPSHETGVASGVNNAVASVASLLAVAIFGAVALGGLNRALDRQLQRPGLSADFKQSLEAARGKFVIEPTRIAAPSQGSSAEAAIRESLAEGIKLGMLLAAGLALISAACAAVTVRPNASRVITASERGPRKIGEAPQQLG